MLEIDCLSINNLGHLCIGGCDTVELSEQYGTPLYVMHEESIRNACRQYKQSINKYYDGHGLPLYASKALNCLEICRIMQDEGMGLDVVSAGELFTALKSGFNPSFIHFHGNNKTHEELNMAIENNVGIIVVDNLEELNNLNKIAKEKNKKINISLRIKPGVEAHTHEFIKTGQIDSKFGFGIENDEAMNVIRLCLNMSNISLKEVHCHIGSQIFELEPFILASKIMMDFIAKVRDEFSYSIDSLNLGGGFGIKYTESDKPICVDECIRQVSNVIKEKAKEHNIKIPFIYVEPGRSIVGPYGITLYRVGSVKNIKNVRTYVSVDGGMTDNPRYPLYRSEYTVLAANKAGDPKDMLVTIAGKCCESGDLIQENVMIQKVKAQDILAVLSTGAYNYSMSSNYNRILKPPIVMIKDNVPRIIVTRQSYEDIIKNDI